MDQPQPLQPASSPVPTPTFTPSEQNPIIIDHKHRPIVGGAFIIIVLTLSIFVGGLLFANYWPNTDEPVVVTTPTPSASAAGVPADWKTYTNTEYGFEVKYPVGGQVDELDSKIVIFSDAKNREVGGGVSTIIVWQSPTDTISRGAKSTFAGKTAYKEVVPSEIGNDFSRIVVPLGRNDIVIDSPLNNTGLDQILSTFKFIEPISAVPVDWKTYTNTQYGFEFRYPGDWSAPVPEGGIPMNFGLYLGPLLDAEGKGVQQFYVSIGALTYPSGGRAGAVTMDQLLIGLKANSSTSNIQDYMTRDGNRVITWEESDICKFAWAALQKLDSSDGVNIIGRCTTVSNPIFQGILSTFKFTK